MAVQEKRRRVSRDTVRSNAENSGGRRYFKLPKGMREWFPEKAGQFMIDILPYEVKKGHPDGIEEGVLWYKFPFKVHHGIGVNQESVVCPTSVGKRCPICERRQKLKNASGENNDDAIQALAPKGMVAYNIIDPDDSDRIALFVFGKGKFQEADAGLDAELKQADESDLNFFDVNKDGRTLVVRFIDKKFSGRAYLLANKIDFKKRSPMDEDEILSAVCCIEECLQVPAYDDLNRVFLQLDSDDEEGGKSRDSDDDDPKPKSGGRFGGGKKSEPEPDEDAEPEPDDEPEEKPKSGKKKDAEPEPDDDEPEPDDDDPDEKPKSGKKPSRAKDDDEEPEPDDEPPTRSGKKPTGGRFGGKR